MRYRVAAAGFPARSPDNPLNPLGDVMVYARVSQYPTNGQTLAGQWRYALVRPRLVNLMAD